MWKIRRILSDQEKETAELAALEKRVFPDPWTSRGIMETLCQDNAMAFGIWKDGILAGYVIFYYVLDEGEIARIAVDPSCRRQGAAGRLCERLEEICREKGIRRLLLEVRRSNEAAAAFYQKWGFTEDGIRKDYYESPREDAVLMSKWL